MDNALALYIMLITFKDAFSTLTCPLFKISPETNGVIVADEYSLLNFTFTLNIENCSNLTNIFVRVEKDGSLVCVIRIDSANCSESKSITVCNCTPRHGVFLFSKTVNRTDNGKWQWTASEGLKSIVETNIMFSITYKARITSLTVNGRSVQGPYTITSNQSLQVVCTWENGNPTTTACLVDNNDNNSVCRNYSGNLSYNSSTRECYNTRNVECKADNSERNETVILLIDCPPRFRNVSTKVEYVMDGKDVDLTYPLHAWRVTRCQLCRYSGQFITSNDRIACNVDIVLECSVFMPIPRQDGSALRKAGTHASELSANRCWCKLHENMPNTTLSLHINDVTMKDGGKWRLDVLNDLGSDSVEMSLVIINGDSAPRLRNDYVNAYVTRRRNDCSVTSLILLFNIPDHLNDQLDWYTDAGINPAESVFENAKIMSVISGCIALTFCSITMFAVCKKRGAITTYDEQRRREIETSASYRVVGFDSPSTGQGSDTYEDILDVSEDIKHEFKQQWAQTTALDDYLHPVLDPIMHHDDQKKHVSDVYSSSESSTKSESMQYLDLLPDSSFDTRVQNQSVNSESFADSLHKQ